MPAKQSRSNRTFDDIEKALSELFNAEDVVDTETGEVIPVSNERAVEYIEGLMEMEMQKIDGIAFQIRKAEGDVAFLKKEEARIAKKRKTRENRVDNFKKYVLGIIRASEQTSISGNTSKLSVRKSQVVELSVSILNTPTDKKPSLPEKYIGEKKTFSIKKAEIRKALKAGGEIEGAKMKNNYTLAIS